VTVSPWNRKVKLNAKNRMNLRASWHPSSAPAENPAAPAKPGAAGDAARGEAGPRAEFTGICSDNPAAL
jgi:hypothetical protein